MKVETVSASDEKEFISRVNELLEDGYKISSTNCGYVGEVGSNIYDCEYWMAILLKH